MKKILFAFFGLLTIAAHAQTVDDIIQKYSAAMGGLDAINKVQSVKFVGLVSVQDMEVPVTVIVLNGKGMRNDVEVMGQSVTNVYYNGKGWKVNPFAGVAAPTDVTGSELNDLRLQSMLANNLMDYKNRGHKVELVGNEDIDGVKTYKINLTSKDDNKVTTYYVSTTDYIMVKSTASKEMMGQDVNVDTYYSDVKTFNGIKFMMTRTQKIDGEQFQEIKLNSVELNIPVDEKIFEKK
jgi:hypothetical protein